MSKAQRYKDVTGPKLFSCEGCVCEHGSIRECENMILAMTFLNKPNCQNDPEIIYVKEDSCKKENL